MKFPPFGLLRNVLSPAKVHYKNSFAEKKKKGLLIKLRDKIIQWELLHCF